MNLKYLKHLAKKGESFIHPGGYGATKLLIEKLAIKPGDKIFEIGCGTGATLVEIASQYDVELHGVDVLDEMLNAAEKRIKAGKFNDKITLHKISPGENLPFADNYFDKLYMESVIGFQDIDTIKFMLGEVRRVLKSRGVFIVCEAFWKEGVPDEIVKKICDSSVKDFGLAQASPSNITFQKFNHLCTQYKFKMQEMLFLDKIPANNLHGEKYNNNKFEYPVSFLREIFYKVKLKTHSGDEKFISSFIVLFVKV